MDAIREEIANIGNATSDAERTIASLPHSGLAGHTLGEYLATVEKRLRSIHKTLALIESHLSGECPS